MRTFEGIEFVAITLKKRLIKHYGEKIKQVVVYGSFARNEATEESGINLPIVIADDLDLYNVRQNLSNLIFDILLENNKLISTIVVVESNFRNYCSEFLSTVKKEGILI
ncbi:nucleotidyltransferase domain-containing protein [Methanosarcinales archaeon]|nr:MAG: nucleotidyltransferase domain-containing protein [Methanosarcinales archaeon]